MGKSSKKKDRLYPCVNMIDLYLIEIELDLDE